jgi:hypothetical protein
MVVIDWMPFLLLSLITSISLLLARMIGDASTPAMSNGSRFALHVPASLAMLSSILGWVDLVPGLSQEFLPQEMDRGPCLP